MPSDLVGRLAQEIRRVDGDHTLGAAALAEALAPFVESALRAGAEPVAWIDHTADGVFLRTLGECRALEDLPHGTKLCTQPATPATVTDEDVGRALCAWVPGSEMLGIRWNVASFIESEQAPFTNTSRADVVRAALESFASRGQPLPTPPASKGGE